MSLLCLWQALIWVFELPSFILPAPLDVIVALWQSRAQIALHASVTAGEVLAGLVLGALLGAATAVQLAASPLARSVLKPVLVITQGLPVFALAPILVLWLGFGLWSKIVMAVLIIYFPVTLAFYDAMMTAPRGWLDLAQTMGAKPSQVLWRIRVPAGVPGLASGLKLAAVYAPIGAVIGEWVGATKGLGYLMLLANGRTKTDLMFATLLVLAVMTLLLHYGVGWLCDRLHRRMT